MTMPSASNLATSKGSQQVVAITAIDTVNMKATGTNRQGSVGVDIDLRYHVGAVHVMPMLYEQWIVAPQGMGWVLVSKLPHNTTDLLTDPVPGQVQIGSTGSEQGPLHLNGSQIAVNAPLSVQTTTAVTRPDPALYPPGTHIYDTDLNMPIWSNGSDWHDATGRTFYTADCTLELTADILTTGRWNAMAAADLEITAATDSLVQQDAQVEAELAVTAESDSSLRAGAHLFANADQIIVASRGTEIHHEAIADADQTINVVSLFIGSRGQGIDAERRVEAHFGAAGDKTFGSGQDITASTTAEMQQSINAESVINLIGASTTAELAHDMSADAELAVTAESGAGMPTDLTADSWQMIQASRTAEATSSADPIPHEFTADSSLDTVAATTAEVVQGTSGEAELEVTAELDADPAQPQDLTADAWQMIQVYRTGEVE